MPPSAAIDVVGRLAGRSLVIVDGDALPAARQHPRVRARGDAATRRPRGFDAHAAWFAAAAGESTAGVRSARQAEYLAFARAERANIDAALAWSAAHDPLARAARSPTASAGRGSCSATSRGAQRLLGALDAAGEAAPARDRADALLLAAWIEASSGHLEPARRHIAEAGGARRRPDLEARCAYYLAYVVSHHGEWEQALELTARAARSTTARPAVGPGRERAVRRAGRDLGRRRRARRRGARRGRALAAGRRRPVAARPPRRDARRARAGRAPLRRRRRAHRPRRRDVRPPRLPPDRGLPGHEPRPRAVPGRRLRGGRRDAGAGDRQGRGDRRRPARRARRASTSAACCARSAATRRGARGARARRRRSTATPGGGEQAALGDCLLAALDGDGAASAARSRRCSTAPAATATRRSRSSRSTRSAG